MAVLLALLGSAAPELTLAVPVMVEPPRALTFTTSVTVKLAPLFRFATLQVTVPVPPTAGAVQEPRLVCTLTKLVPAGTASLATTPLAAVGPWLLTVMV